MGTWNRAPAEAAGKLGIGRSAAGRENAVPRRLGCGKRRRGCMSVEQAVFLVGGLGTRLHSLTAGNAKPLLDVGGRPFLDYLLDEASRHGIKRALLLCGYRADDIMLAYGGRTVRGMRIDAVAEATP